MTPADKRWGATFLTLGAAATMVDPNPLSVITAAAAILTGAYILITGSQR